MSMCFIRFPRQTCVDQYVAFLKSNVGLQPHLRHLRIGSYNSQPKDEKPSSLEVSTGYSVSSLPDPPTNCCMSGCANCVWIEYAFQVTEHYSAEKAPHVLADAIELLDDVNMKAFLRMELKLRGKH